MFALRQCLVVRVWLCLLSGGALFRGGFVVSIQGYSHGLNTGCPPRGGVPSGARARGGARRLRGQCRCTTLPLMLPRIHIRPMHTADRSGRDVAVVQSVRPLTITMRGWLACDVPPVPSLPAPSAVDVTGYCEACRRIGDLADAAPSVPVSPHAVPRLPSHTCELGAAPVPSGTWVDAAGVPVAECELVGWLAVADALDDWHARDTVETLALEVDA